MRKPKFKIIVKKHLNGKSLYFPYVKYWLFWKSINCIGDITDKHDESYTYNKKDAIDRIKRTIKIYKARTLEKTETINYEWK